MLVTVVLDERIGARLDLLDDRGDDLLRGESSFVDFALFEEREDVDVRFEHRTRFDAVREGPLSRWGCGQTFR